MTRRTFVDAIVFVLVLAGGTWALLNQQDIRDWWVLRSYQPSAEISALAEATDMNERGERVFFASRPQLNDRSSFNTNCPFPDRSLVLGCFADSHIYIFKVDNTKLDGVEEVTAAHEMLHAAYARMSGSERKKIDKLTADAYAGLRNDRLTQIIDGYRKDDPESVPNELHSILGTEIRELPAELEAHYANYFDDRGQVVKIAESYEQVFVALQDKIAKLSNQIASLKNKIEKAEQDLGGDKASLDAEANRLKQLRDDGDFDEYNAGVPGYNALVSAYNAAVEDYKGFVSSHNKLVEDYNDLALEQNQLVQSLNSKFQPIGN